ncbi:hypothetical protein H5410_040120 [Solanum commersonii]|uniref:RING-CH-type domain-containing protein n=1 Tax=Solanum commersonii TaxID=4109 RepID=A0A9J5XRK7_SOLCO|nr:hypothetical protein H5410_040120 [Solanum commersonii]
MVDEFMVCVDRIIIATTCFGDSSVTNGVGGRETLLTSDAVNVNSTVEIINLRKTHQEKISTSSSSCVGDGGEGSSKGSSSSSVRECRICQEEDEETDMEAPCACNGTLKFAHRKCIQKWCNKKGDITCEICNKVFSPNYTLPLARSNPDVMAIDIRYVLQKCWFIETCCLGCDNGSRDKLLDRQWGPGMDTRNPHFLAFAAAERQFLQSEYDDYAIASSGSLACFRYVAIIVFDATLADTPNLDGHKGLCNGAGPIYLLQCKSESLFIPYILSSKIARQGGLKSNAVHSFTSEVYCIVSAINMTVYTTVLRFNLFIMDAFSDFTSSAGGFPPPLLCNGSDMVHDTMPKKEAAFVVSYGMNAAVHQPSLSKDYLYLSSRGANV